MSTAQGTLVNRYVLCEVEKIDRIAFVTCVVVANLSVQVCPYLSNVRYLQERLNLFPGKLITSRLRSCLFVICHFRHQEAIAMPRMHDNCILRQNKRPGGFDDLLDLLPDETNIDLWIMEM